MTANILDKQPDARHVSDGHVFISGLISTASDVGTARTWVIPLAVCPRALLAGDDAAAVACARARCHCLFPQVIVHHFLCWEDMRLPARQAFNLPYNRMAFEINRMKITRGVSWVQIWKLNLTRHLSFVTHCLAERGGHSSTKQKP